MRDQIVDLKFLVERESELTKTIDRRIHLLPETAYQLARDRFNLVKVHYSLGTPLDEVAEMFRGACRGTIETGVELGLPSSTFPIVGMLRLFGEDDLREQMIPQLRSRSDQIWRRAHDFLMGFEGVDDDANYPVPGGGVSHVRTWWLIEQARVDPHAAQPMLEELVRKHWIQSNSNQPWYGGHENPRTPYSGYWCYEAAAIAQMFGIDDSALEGHKYYPYELAHYLD